MAAPVRSAWFVEMDQFAVGAHGTLKCQECHGSMQEKDKSHPDDKAADFLKTDPKRTFDYGTCQRCHKTAHARFLQGEHAKALAKEKEDGFPSEAGVAPTCGDCHSAHYAKSHQTRVMVGKQTAQSCGACHPDQLTSYLSNYHGKAAVHLDHDKAAFCTDCHGAHTTISLKDKDAALAACKRCHKDAGPKFADIIIHDSTKNMDAKSRSKQAGLKWVHSLGTLSLIFVVGLLVFFYAHSGLLMLRKLHETLRRHK